MNKQPWMRLAALTICFANPLHAVTLNPRGLGQALIYPYYTVNKSQDTLVSVVNTSNIGKVAKVRFLEGYNGRVVLDFLLFLSPNDVWSARISQTANDGGAEILTGDTSCVYPAKDASGHDIHGSGIPFTNSGYAGGGAYPGDGGPTSITRTREGHLEIIADGDIIPGSPTDLRITHVQNGQPNGGVPHGCDQLGNSLFASDMVAPSIGLMGSASIVNVGEGTFLAYNADALTGFTSVPLTDKPGIGDYDSLTRANSAESRLGGAVAYLSNDAGLPLALDYASGIDAVSAVFMADAIHNEYLVDTSLGAATDWIVTFPTKRFYTDSLYTGGGALAPFDETFGPPGQSNIAIHGDIHDREEGFTDTYPPVGGCGFICPGGQPVTLPYEVNVVRVLPTTTGNPSEVLGSLLDTILFPYPAPFNNVSGPGNAGWVKLDLHSLSQRAHQLSAGTSSTGAHIGLNGLPVTGLMVYNVINADAQPGLLANYGGAFRHRESMSCSTINPSTPAYDPCT